MNDMKREPPRIIWKMRINGNMDREIPRASGFIPILSVT